LPTRQGCEFIFEEDIYVESILLSTFDSIKALTGWPDWHEKVKQPLLDGLTMYSA